MKSLENKKLKELLYEYLEEINNDIASNIEDTAKVLVINKYRNMLTNIIDVCKDRNKF